MYIPMTLLVILFVWMLLASCQPGRKECERDHEDSDDYP